MCGRRGRRGYGGKSLSEPEQEPGGIRTNKERRCPHSGQLPSSGVTLENMTAGVWSLRAVIFLVIIFSNRVLRGASHEKSLGRASK